MSREEFFNLEANPALGKKLTIGSWVVTVAVWGLVGLMRGPTKIPLPEGVTLEFLPMVHAGLNCLVALFLILKMPHLNIVVSIPLLDWGVWHQ